MILATAAFLLASFGFAAKAGSARALSVEQIPSLRASATPPGEEVKEMILQTDCVPAGA